MDRIRRATLQSYRESRNGMKNRVPPMAKREALGWPEARMTTDSDDRGRRTDPVTMPITSKPVA